MKKAIAVAVLAGLMAGTAQAGLIQVSGDTSTSEFDKWNHPNGASGNGNRVRYDVIEFSVDLAGSYTLSATSSAFDAHVYVYEGAFDASKPTTNLMVPSANSSQAMWSLLLNTDTQYFLVVTGAKIGGGNGNGGQYGVTFDGLGNVLLPAAGTPEIPGGEVPPPTTAPVGPIGGAPSAGELNSVPEPGVLALLGFGAAGLCLTRRRRV